MVKFGTEIASHVIQVGHVRLERAAKWEEIRAVCGDLDSPLRCVDAAVQEKMKAEVDAAAEAGDTVGGVFEIVAHKVPVGLGSHAQWMRSWMAAGAGADERAGVKGGGD